MRHGTQQDNLVRAGNMIARSRRDALRIIAEGGPHTHYRLALIGERLLAAFREIDASTTREQRLMLIGANLADARTVKAGQDSMLHLLWVEGLEWSAQRRHDDWIAFANAPLYWAVGLCLIDWMHTPEAAPHVDAVLRDMNVRMRHDTP